MWRIISNGPLIPKKKMEETEMNKKESEWDINDFKIAQFNAKALHILFCALWPSEYNRVSLCDNAKKA